MTPEELGCTTLFQELGGRLVLPAHHTCTGGEQPRVLDYFYVSRAVNTCVESIDVMHTHLVKILSESCFSFKFTISLFENRILH